MITTAPICLPEFVTGSTPVEPKKAANQTPREVVRRALARRYKPGQIIELRAPGVSRGEREIVYGGLYTDHEALIRDIAFLVNETDAPAIYTGLQEIKSTPEYQQLVGNKLEVGRSGASACDIDCYRWLLVDVDTVRPKDFTKSCSTDAEKASGFEVAEQVYEYLHDLGVEADFIDSGNSYHVVAALDFPATAENELLLEAVLKSLANQFDTAQATVDTSVYDRPRICKLPGTPVRKGDESESRPHRYSAIVSEAKELNPVPLGVLLKIANLESVPKTVVQIQAPSSEIEKSLDWLRGFIDWSGLSVQIEKSHQGGIILVLESDCPFEHNSGHHAGECHVGVNKQGKLAFACKHDSCEGRGWKGKAAL